VETARFRWSRAEFVDDALRSAVISVLSGWVAYETWGDERWLAVGAATLFIISAGISVGWLTASGGPALIISDTGLMIHGRGVFHRRTPGSDYPWQRIRGLRVEDGSGPRLTRRITCVNLHIDLEPEAQGPARHPMLALTLLSEPFDEVVASLRRGATLARVELEVDPGVLARGALRRPTMRISRRSSR
jgi:hypothetical protein